MASTSQSLQSQPADSWAKGLTNGSYWSLGTNRTITWGLADLGNEKWNYAVASSVIKDVLAEYSSVANLNFSYLGSAADPALSSADLVFVRTSLADRLGMGNALAWAYFPYDTLAEKMVANTGLTAKQYPNAAGDIWLNMGQPEMYYSTLEAGSTLYFALLHEVGHALGLKHPHDDGGTGRPTFRELGISGMDNQLLTIMSYDEASSVASWYASYGLPSSVGYPSTLMPMDVVALQSIYGPNTQTHLGDTTYNLRDDSRIETYWDAGGVDTIAAGVTSGGWYVDMDIVHGNYRIALAAPLEQSNISETGKFFFNAENISGSFDDDVLIGDGIANNIDGSFGNDLIFGGAGADTLNGGFGEDIIDGGSGNDVISASFDDDILVLLGNDKATGGFGKDYFCITGPGDYTITDFYPSEDLLIFDSQTTPYHDVASLLKGVTGYSMTTAGINVAFGSDIKINLLGCRTTDIGLYFYPDISGLVSSLIDGWG